MSVNHSSAEISVLMGIAELAKRCGLRPSDADTALVYYSDSDTERYKLLFAWRDSEHPDEVERFQKLLGVKEPFEEMAFADIADLEDRVDQALSLAPRARAR